MTADADMISMVMIIIILIRTLIILTIIIIMMIVIRMMNMMESLMPELSICENILQILVVPIPKPGLSRRQDQLLLQDKMESDLPEAPI